MLHLSQRIILQAYRFSCEVINGDLMTIRWFLQTIVILLCFQALQVWIHSPSHNLNCLGVLTAFISLYALKTTAD